jgi:hypothetical protein
MLSTRSFANDKPIIEKTVKVRVMKPLYVAGKEHTIGDVVSISLSDARCLRNREPPAVEML